jgi:hypothetical protein
MLGNLVARRCTRVHCPNARETIYFLHDLSHRQPNLRHYACNLFPAWPWPSDGPESETSFEKLARELCAERGVSANIREEFPAFLTRLCLDPTAAAESASFPGFPAIMGPLRRYREKFESAAMRRIARTETAKAIWNLLDYAMTQRGLVLAEGAYRTGKSIASQAWAQSHLGRCRYVQLSSAKDDASFFRDIARAVGVACSSQMKAAEMRQRIEAVLREQHLLLIIDEADWIWPQATNLKEIPHRLAWMLTSLCNNGVPVALIGSRNFARLEANVARRPRLFGLEQFHGRLKLRVQLPQDVSKADMVAIAGSLLPNADARTRALVVAHALKSPVPVPAIEAAAARAAYFASEAGRSVAAFEDVEAVMAEAGTLPADYRKPARPAPTGPPQSFRASADAPRAHRAAGAR